MIPQSVKNTFRDLQNIHLPKSESSLEKLGSVTLEIGKRIYWYYQEDLEMFEDEKENIKDYYSQLFSGLIIAPSDVDSDRELDIDQCIVIITDYPCEKESPSVDWVSLNRLLDDDSLIEIFEVDN